MRNSTEELVLYGTSACHLCDLAEDMLRQHSTQFGKIQYRKSDISESEELFHRYGIRIPVLLRVDGAELDWPFSAQQLALFLTG